MKRTMTVLALIVLGFVAVDSYATHSRLKTLELYIQTAPGASGDNMIVPTSDDTTSLDIKASSESGTQSFDNFVIRGKDGNKVLWLETDGDGGYTLYAECFVAVRGAVGVLANDNSGMVYLAAPNNMNGPYSVTFPPAAPAINSVLKSTPYGDCFWY